MVVAFTCYFVASISNISYQLRHHFCYPSQDEKRRAYVELVEQRQRPACADLESPLEAAPSSAVDESLKR